MRDAVRIGLMCMSLARVSGASPGKEIRGAADGGEPLPAECAKDIDPTGVYDVTLVSVPLTPETGTVLPPQCRAAKTGTKLDVRYRVTADVDANYPLCQRS